MICYKLLFFGYIVDVRAVFIIGGGEEMQNLNDGCARNWQEAKGRTSANSRTHRPIWRNCIHLWPRWLDVDVDWEGTRTKFWPRTRVVSVACLSWHASVVPASLIIPNSWLVWVTLIVLIAIHPSLSPIITLANSFSKDLTLLRSVNIADLYVYHSLCV